jgi:hypothetical protein
MGWSDIKYMLLIMLMVDVMAFAYSSAITDISSVSPGAKKSLDFIVDTTKVSYKPIIAASEVLYNESLTLSGAVGSEIDSWTKRPTNDTSLDPFTVINFLVASWNWFLKTIIGLYNFTYAPIVLVLDFLRIDNYNFLFWLPMLLYILWSFMYLLTIMGWILGDK